jgi:hypothetical protein
MNERQRRDGMKQSQFLNANWFRLCAAIGILLQFRGEGLAQTAMEKHPIPTVSQQSEIKKLLEETYSLKKADNPAKKEQAAATLLEAVEGGELSSDETYVVLTSVLALTKDAGKFEAFMDAVDQLGKTFEGDPIQIKQKQVVDFLQDCKNGESLKVAIAEAISIARADAAENRFPEAMALLASADAANRRTTGGAATKQTITEARKSVAARETQWKAYQKAKVTLAKSPADAEANWAVGRWTAVADNDWTTALPMLAKGSNAAWKAASELELKTSSENAGQIAVGDAWWDIAQSDTTETKLVILRHAGESYARALPGTTALQKLRIERRISEIGDVPATASMTTSLKPAASYEKPVDITPPEARALFSEKRAVTRFADWNADGESDILVGDEGGNVWLLMNTGKGKLSAPKPVVAGGLEIRFSDSQATPRLADLNGDSKPDLIIAHSDNKVTLFENKGTAKSPRFDGPQSLATVTGSVLQLVVNARGRMDVGDWDGDGDLDLVAGRGEGPITCYRNVGTAKAPKFAEGVPLEIDGKVQSFSYNVQPLLFDINQDGIVDIVYGLNWGTMRFLIADKTRPVDKPLGSGMPLIRQQVSPVYSSGEEIDLRKITGDNATPTVGDVDGDGILDIVTGGNKILLLKGVSKAPAQ